MDESGLSVGDGVAVVYMGAFKGLRSAAPEPDTRSAFVCPTDDENWAMTPAQLAQKRWAHYVVVGTVRRVTVWTQDIWGNAHACAIRYATMQIMVCYQLMLQCSFLSARASMFALVSPSIALSPRCVLFTASGMANVVNETCMHMSHIIFALLV